MQSAASCHHVGQFQPRSCNRFSCEVTSSARARGGKACPSLCARDGRRYLEAVGVTLTRSGAAFAEVTEVARTDSGRSGPTAASFHCRGSNRAWTKGEDEPRPPGLALA